MSISHTFFRRRGLLRRGLQLAGGVLGLGVVGRAESAHAAAVAPAGPATTTSTSTTITLTGRHWRVRSRDFRPGQYPAAGDRAAISGELLDGQHGEPVGAFYATSFYVDTWHGDQAQAVDSHQLHTLHLPGGTLSGMGTATFGETPDTFAVVGGTGAYLGATGSYVVRQSPLEFGGDGTAEFAITLTA